MSTGLQFVSTPEEARASLLRFNAGARNSRTRAENLLSTTSYWVFEPDGSLFGPAKFVGFCDMDFDKYQQAKRSHSPKFEGHRTMSALQGACGKKFVSDATMSQELTKWGVWLLGKGCFDGVDLGKWSFLTLPLMNEKGVQSLYRELDSTKLDSSREVVSRTEQGFLRRYIFGGRTEVECVLCGHPFPIDLLVAAHIKKRSECSTDEKLDYRSNVAPMCRFGCDELFERRYVVVNGNGKICRASTVPATERVESYLNELVGRQCGSWNPQSAPYFKWHSKT